MSGILLALKIVALKMTILIRPSPKFLNSLHSLRNSTLPQSGRVKCVRDSSGIKNCCPQNDDFN